MFTRKLPAFFAIAILTVLAISPEINAQQLITFSVDGNKQINKSGEKINKRDMVCVADVSGTFTFATDGRAKPSMTANEGFEGKTGFGQYNKIPGGGLAVGTSMNNYSQAKPGALFTSNEDGDLFFGINDAAYPDNSGGYTVTYAVIRKQDLKTFSVDGNKQINKSGEKINKRDMVCVADVSGTFTFATDGRAKPSMTANEGFEGKTGFGQYNKIPGGGLAVGTSMNNYSQAKPGALFTSNEDGDLFFGINDAAYPDNSGGYTVTYAIIRHK